MATNLELAEAFGEMADLVRVADGNNHSHRARAYEAAARTLQGLPAAAAEMTTITIRLDRNAFTTLSPVDGCGPS